MDLNHLITDTLISGLPLVPVTVGIYLVFRVREDFDLTVDGSFATGGAVGSLALTEGVPVPLAMTLAVLAGGCAGMITATLHAALRIPVILAGLVTAVALFSVNLRVMDAPSIGLAGTGTVFSAFESSPHRDTWTILVLVAFAVGTLGFVAWFLRTEIGLALRVSGTNVGLARAQGASEIGYIFLSLFLANALAAFSGVLVIQEQNFADVNMGTGILLIGVGAFLLGELVTRPTGSKVLRAMLAVLIGALLYRAVLVFALQVGLPPTDVKLATSLTLVGAFVLHRIGSLTFSQRRPGAPKGLLEAVLRRPARGESRGA